MKLGDVEYPSLEGRVGDGEWAARVELAALYRLTPLMGWDSLSITHISARVPGEPHYLFNPKGFLFEEVTASSLVKINLEGEIVSETPFGIVDGGWHPMKAVHAVREDANFVIHVHDLYGVALSARKEGLQPISQTAGFALGDGVAYHAYDGVETYEERVAGLQASLGNANRLILHNHGLVTLGPTARSAFMRMNSLREACRIQVLAGRDHLIQIEPQVASTFAAELARAQGNDAWPGLLRKLERLDPSYKA
jgi:ribulose-5-phosphate 4-epimerase/fuculose-1-phosphate aldolase